VSGFVLSTGRGASAEHLEIELPAGAPAALVADAMRLMHR